MAIHPRAGQRAQAQELCNIPRLVSAYYTNKPDRSQGVAFGTSGHRGSSVKHTFTETHILAVCQAIVEYRRQNSIAGPLFLGIDTHALSECAFATAIEVFAANQVNVVIQKDRGYTPTPVISHAILTYNQTHPEEQADGVIITPSHNPPEDGGIKYNPPHGGPADESITNLIQNRANELIELALSGVERHQFDQAIKSEFVTEKDYVKEYVEDLENVIDMQAIARSGIRIGVDPLGGSGIAYWDVIASHYGINISVVNDSIDPQFGFMCLDKDGAIRMDCSSPFAMAGLIAMKDDFDIAIGNDPDYDRHGIVTPSGGLMNPNHFLAVAIDYLASHRPNWSDTLAIGKTLVSSGIIDRVCKGINRPMKEVPVGFKWFVDGLYSGNLAFGGEESAGASFLRRDGQVWTTDKDGFILALLAAEITAVTGQDPSMHYERLTEQYGSPLYKRIDAAATPEQKLRLKNLSSDDVQADQLAGEVIIEKLTQAPGNQAAIGGLKVVTENGWFAARPSGTENIYKIYAESFLGESHLERLIEEAQTLVSQTIDS